MVTDAEGRLLELDVPGHESKVILKNPDLAEPISIERVVLVPMENWSPDFILPTSSCVQGKDSTCIVKPSSQRFSQPESTVIAIPSRILEQKPSRQMPKGIHDETTPLVYIDRYSPDHASNKADPDDYVFMVHYYQPDHPLLYLQVNITNGPAVDEVARGDQGGVLVPDLPVYEAVLPLPTCAASQGCRSAVLRNKEDKQPGQFGITEEFDIKFINQGPDGGWIEYVMAVPGQDFTPELLVPDDSVDRAEEFVEECAKDHYYMPDTMEEGFCRAAVTSISADFNERALQCDCDTEGSIDHYNCNSFGGQCQCKPHVIGQSCTRCGITMDLLENVEQNFMLENL